MSPTAAGSWDLPVSSFDGFGSVFGYPKLLSGEVAALLLAKLDGVFDLDRESSENTCTLSLDDAFEVWAFEVIDVRITESVHVGTVGLDEVRQLFRVESAIAVARAPHQHRRVMARSILQSSSSLESGD